MLLMYKLVLDPSTQDDYVILGHIWLSRRRKLVDLFSLIEADHFDLVSTT